MKEKKLHLGLENLEMDTRYNIGYFDIDFADGNLVFQVFLTPCQTARCRCDHVRVELVTEGTKLTAWYTSEKEWQDENHKAAPPELLNVLQIIEKTDRFQERYLHIAYLRRKYVLDQNHRHEDPFMVRLSRELVPENSEHLGKVALALQGREKAYDWDLTFCGNPSCYCSKINFVIYVGTEELVFWIDKDNQITAHDPQFSPNRLAKVRQRMKKNERFWKLVGEFRLERVLENYHRFVKQYSGRVSSGT